MLAVGRALARSPASRASGTTTRSWRRCTWRTACRGRSRSRSRSTTRRPTGSAAPTPSRSPPAEGARAARDPADRARSSSAIARRRRSAVYGTEDAEHPGVAAMHAAGEFCVAGELRVHRAAAARRLPRVPADARADARRVRRARAGGPSSGFQTRNPIHRAHEYIQKCALEIVDGLLVHPLVGATKGDDVPADVRMRCYEALFEGYYPKDRAMVSRVPRRDALRRARRRRSGTRSAARTTAARTSSSGATTPASAATTAPTTRRRSSSGSSRASSASRR